MSIGKTARKNDLKAFSLKLKLKDGEKFLDKPVFEVSKREGDKFVILPEKESEVSGNLIGVEPREYVYEGSPIRSFTATLQDNDEIYFVNVPLNGLGRGLANSLLALKDFTDVQIGLYASKPKTEGARSFPAASLRQGGEIIRWKFDQAALPTPEEVTFKGKTQRDWTKTEVFLSDQLKELNKLVKQKTHVQAVSTAETAPTEKGDLDVPF